MSKNQRKGLLPTNSYNCTIRQSYPARQNKEKKHLNPDTLVIVWTVDASKEKYLWRNLEQTFDPDSDLDMWNLEKIANILNFTPYEVGHKEFYSQWKGLRAQLNVTVDLSKDSRFKKNVILEHSLPQRPAEIDVTKPKDNSHFTSNQKNRELPI